MELARCLGFYTKPNFFIGYNVFDYLHGTKESKPIQQFLNNRNNLFCKKLFRDFGLYIYRDGLFVISVNDVAFNIEFDKKMQLKLSDYSRYVLLANTIQTVLYTSTQHIFSNESTVDRKEDIACIPFELYDINNNNAIILNCKDDFNTVDGVSFNIDINNHEKFMKRDKTCKNMLLDYVHYISITDDSFSRFIDEFENIYSNIQDNVDLMHILIIMQKASIAVSEFRFDISIILSWTIIERVLYDLWKDFLSEKVHVNKRRKDLEDNRDYTASVITNILYMARILTVEQIDDIDRIRKERNKLMHGNYNLFSYNVDTLYQVSTDALGVASKVVSFFYKMPLTIGTNIRF